MRGRTEELLAHNSTACMLPGAVKVGNRHMNTRSYVALKGALSSTQQLQRTRRSYINAYINMYNGSRVNYYEISSFT